MVDDDQQFRDFAAAALRGVGHTVVPYECPLGLLACMEQSTDSPPEVVITDWAMPNGGGERVIKLFRGQYIGLGVKLIVVSACDGLESHCLARGADAFLQKPVSLGDLRSTVKELLSGS